MAEISRIFIDSPEPGIQLEVIVARPTQSNGPYPTLVFNHGSTGTAKPKMIAMSMCPSTIASYFTERGWLVLFPQRRGRGKSGGHYAEGLNASGRDYSCEVEIAVRGFNRAVQDLGAVVAYVKTHDDTDLGRVAIGGTSRGGVLSIAYAGLSSFQFCGAINFNGGWLGKACPSHEFVNPMIFKKGAAFGKTTLWLHGTRDPYYRIDHCKRNFSAFLAAGGKGIFVAAPGGHGLIFKPELWKQQLDTYLLQLERVAQPEGHEKRSIVATCTPNKPCMN